MKQSKLWKWRRASEVWQQLSVAWLGTPSRRDIAGATVGSLLRSDTNVFSFKLARWTQQGMES